MTDYPYLVELQRDVEKHGEIHAVVEETDREVELRKGQTEFHYDRGCVTVEGTDTTHVFAADSFVRHYCPYDVFHE